MKRPTQVLPTAAAAGYFDHPWHREIAAYRLPGKITLEIPDAIVTGAEFLHLEAGRGGVYREDGGLVECSRHRRRGKDFAAENEPRLSKGRILRLSRRLPGTWIYLGWYFNHYGHFLVESLARSWVLLDEEERDVRGCLFHLHARDGRPSRRNMELLELLGLSRSDVRFIDRDLRVERLLVPAQLMVLARGVCETMRPVYRRITDRAQSVAKRARYPGKIYVSRRLLPEGQRKAVDEERVEACYRARGFEIVHPQFLPFSEQVNLFFAAREIHGFEGSGLHNVLFSREGVRMRILGTADRMADCVTQEVLNAFAGCETVIRLREPQPLPWLPSTRLPFLTPAELLAEICGGTEPGGCHGEWIYRFRYLNGIAVGLKQTRVDEPEKLGEISRALRLSGLEERVFLSLVLLMRGDTEKTLELAAGNNADDKGTPLLWYLLASIHRKRGEIAVAETHLCRLLAAGAGNQPEVHRDLAQLLGALGKGGEALDAARQAIRLDPDDPAGYLILGQLLLQLGDDEAALQAFDDALAIDPYALAVRHRRVQALGRLKRFDAAVAELERALDLAPGNRRVREQMTWFLLQSGRWKAAESSAREALGVDETDPTSRSHLSQALAAQGRLEEALEAIGGAIELEPGRVFFHRYQSELYRRLGDQERAQESLRKARELTVGSC